MGFSVGIVMLLLNSSQIPLPLFPGGSLFGKPISQKTSSFIRPTAYVRSVIDGLLISDAWMMRQDNRNARLGFRQSIKHFQYLWFVFTIQRSYCNSFPIPVWTRQKGKTHLGVQVTTRSLPFLTEIWNEWYSTGEKRLSSNIYELLTPVVIAHWIMGDGNRHKELGLVLATDAYTLDEILRI